MALVENREYDHLHATGDTMVQKHFAPSMQQFKKMLNSDEANLHRARLDQATPLLRSAMSDEPSDHMWGCARM